MKHLPKAWLVALALLTIALPSVARAQSQATTAEINGRVVDAQGGVLPGVTVTITAPATGYTRAVTTNTDGLFTVPLLPPGTYEVSMELAGFSGAKRSVPLTVGAVITLNQQLGVGAVQENVVVNAQSPAVETTATVRTTTVSTEAISNLPINGRRFQDFITLTPTVQVDTSRGQLSFSGQRGINANVAIDGADHNQPFFGGIRGGERSNNAFTVPQEAIREFQVVAAGYSAEFGRSTGGLVNAITKSGTNTERGSAFYVNRHKDLANENAFGQVAAPTQQQFGGSIGGPIARDRIFYFGAVEVQRFDNTRRVAFSLTGITPNADNNEALTYFRSLEEPFDTTNNAEAYLGRVDVNLSGGSRLAFRYNFSNNTAENANATGNALSDTTISAVSNNGTEKDKTSTFVGEYTSALSSNSLLEVRGQFGYEKRPRDANALQPLYTGTVGNVGTVSFLGENVQSDKRGQINANLTSIFSSHSLKVGSEYNRVTATQKFGFNQFGAYTVSGTSAAMLELSSVGGTTPNRFDAASNVVNYRIQIGNLEADIDSHELAFYAQDAWKVTPTLTFNYGLRWEGAFNPTPEANNDYILNALNGYTFPIGRTVDATQIPDQLQQWSPRFGFAWDPGGDGKSVLRGYTGIYYARTPMLVYAGPMNNFRVPPGDVSLQLPFTSGLPAGSPTTLYQQLRLIGVDLNTMPLSALPTITPAQATAVAAALGLTPNPYNGAAVIAVDKDFKNPRAKQAGFGYEHEVARNLTLGADVTYVKTDRLERNRELNLGVPTPNAADPAQRPIFPSARPLAALGSVQVRESTASSEYTALALTSRLTRTRGIVSINYVLSKSMSDDDNERDSGGAQYENSFNLSPEWSAARLDRRHQFNGFVAAFLPYGFDASTAFRIQSALPIDAAFGRDINASLGGPDRPFSAPGVPFERNAFRNEPFKEINIRLQWGATFASTRRLILSAELFNIFNWENIQLAGATVTNYCAGTAPSDCGFGAPTNPNFLSLTDNTPGSPTNGQLIQTNSPGAPRQVQLGLRFEF